MNPFTSSVIHVLEFVLVVGAAVLVARFFPEHRDASLLLVGTTLSGMVKFMRASPAVPLPDYVNGEEAQ